MFNWQPFLDLINSKDCTHEYNLLNFSDLKKVAKAFFKNTKYQSENKTHFFSKIILVPMSYITSFFRPYKMLWSMFSPKNDGKSSPKAQINEI